MMAVGILIVIDDHTGLRISGDVVKATRHGAVLIHILKEGFNCLGHSVCPAKRPYRAGFRERVGLLFHLALHNGDLPLRHGPLGCVAPIGVFCENGIRVEQRAFDFTENKLAVRGGGGQYMRRLGS